ncbi:MAG: DUF3109 family protein [Rhodothermales bacterium]
MFAVDYKDTHVLVSDDLVDASFCCNLGACLGACCVEGESGAPLQPDERRRLEELLPVVRSDLREEALRVIESEGVWEEVGKGEYATTCVDGSECVFVTYDGPVARCAIQKAHEEGRIDFPKPISCHLFPVRIVRIADIDALNYQSVPMCSPALRKGRKEGMALYSFLREPLVRKYGKDWYEAFEKACEERSRLIEPCRP